MYTAFALFECVRVCRGREQAGRSTRDAYVVERGRCGYACMGRDSVAEPVASHISFAHLSRVGQSSNRCWRHEHACTELVGEHGFMRFLMCSVCAAEC